MSSGPLPRPRPSGALAALAITLFTSSCLLMARGDASRFYVLRVVAEPAPSGGGSLDVGLGPITIPGYLRRPTLATRVSTTDQVRYAEFDRWAEPLSSQFQRTLGQDLASALGAERVVPFPWYPTTPVDVAVRVNVVAFETDTAGQARLDAEWTIHDPRTAAVLRGGRSVITEPVDGEGAPAAVAALSRTVAELASRIASGIPQR